MRKIKDLASMPKPDVYLRNGILYTKLNEGWQVKVKLKKGNVIGDGICEPINPEELVEVLKRKK